MRNNNPVTRGLARQRAVYAVLRVCLGGLFAKITGFTCERYRPQSRVFLLLGNHNLDVDAVYAALGVGRHMRFVASENITKGFLGGVVRFLAGPIPRRKGASADETVAKIRENLQTGVSVGMHPEGNKSWDGETCFISRRTAELVKSAAGGLITYRIDGGYLKAPRWAKYHRRGPIHGRVVREYLRAELDAMSADEIHAAICADLYVDAFAVQAQAMHRYKGKNLAEGIENALYVCPHCEAVDSMRSQGNAVSCAKCGCTVTYTEYGFFEGEPLPFKTVLDWSRWQKEWLRAQAGQLRSQTQTPIVADTDVILRRRGDGAGEVLLADASVSVYGDRLEVASEDGRLVFPLSGITAMGAFRTSRLLFTSGGAPYEVVSGDAISGQKYFALWRLLTGKEYV